MKVALHVWSQSLHVEETAGIRLTGTIINESCITYNITTLKYKHISCCSDSLVGESLTKVRATYLAGSVSESHSMVDESLIMQPRATSMPLIMLMLQIECAWLYHRMNIWLRHDTVNRPLFWSILSIVRSSGCLPSSLAAYPVTCLSLLFWSSALFLSGW